MSYTHVAHITSVDRNNRIVDKEMRRVNTDKLYYIYHFYYKQVVKQMKLIYNSCVFKNFPETLYIWKYM